MVEYTGAIEQVMDAISKAGAEAALTRLTCRRSPKWTRWCSLSSKSSDGLTSLCNNAGICPRAKPDGNQRGDVGPDV